MITRQVEAETVALARQRLETLGYTEIVFLEDELTAQMERVDAGDFPEDYSEDAINAEAIDVGLRKGNWGYIYLFLKYNLILLIPLGFLVYFATQGETATGFWDWIIYLLAGGFLVYALGLGLPILCYDRIQTHCVRGNWRRMYFWVICMGAMPWVVKFRSIRMEVDYRRAEAMLHLGHEQKALTFWESCKPESDAEWTAWAGHYASLLASLQRYDEAWKTTQEAFQKTTDSNSLRIDCARFRIRYFQDAEGAETYLNEAKEHEIVELAKSYVTMIEGAIALEKKDYQKALSHFDHALEEADAFKSIPLFEGHRQEVRVYRILALAGMSRVEEAKALYERLEPFMKGQGDTLFLNRCHQALMIN